MWHRKAHLLGKPTRVSLPKFIVFYDTETTEVPIDEKQKKLVLRLGHAVHCRVDPMGVVTVDERYDFTSASDFNSWLASKTSQRKRLFVVAHNIGFDLRITGTLAAFADMGWDRTSLVDEGLNFIATLRKHDATIRFINNQQLFAVSLRRLGESIGEYKTAVDFASASEDELRDYCRQDVQVMVTAWEKWLRFVVDNGLGSFKITAASQALGGFRYRFLDDPVYIHTHQRAIDLERSSYHGGRVECFFIGHYTRGAVYSLDINSMYPAVMREAVPTKLLKHYGYSSLAQFAALRRKYDYIAEVTLELKRPCLPVVDGRGKLTFPVGKVRGTFTKPELEYALDDSTLLAVHKLNIYSAAAIFTGYVDFFYEARQKYKREGNDAFSYLSKLMLNSLYGKFGQRQREYTRIGYQKSLPDGIYQAFIDSLGRIGKVRVLDGIIERESGSREAYNAFPAISSYITARARVLLDTLIERAGREQVLYCDTDSLFVTEEGYRRLADDIDNSELGKLKLLGVEDGMTIKTAKHYTYGNKSVKKGVRENATEVAPSVFQQDQFMSFSGTLRTGDLSGVVVKKILKHISGAYSKGFVSPDGRVLPFHSPQFSPQAAILDSMPPLISASHEPSAVPHDANEETIVLP